MFFCINQSMGIIFVSLFCVFSRRQSTSIILKPTWRPRSISLEGGKGIGREGGREGEREGVREGGGGEGGGKEGTCSEEK